MSLISSVTANGKLWIDEADYRSPIHTAPGNDNAGVGLEGGIGNKTELKEIVRRQYGKQLAYGTGVWFLDLIGKGWWDDKDIWQEIHALQDLTGKYASIKSNQAPEVALVYDSAAVRLLGDPWNVAVDIYQDIRDKIARTGLSYGLYTTQDVANGFVDDAKLYIMMTPWRMDKNTTDKLKKVLHRSGVTTMWLYGYGDTDPVQFKQLTGMTINRTAGSKKSLQVEMTADAGKTLPGMGGKTIPNARQAYERYFVEDSGVNVLGRYADGKQVAVAAVSRDGWNSLFYGGFHLPVEFLQASPPMRMQRCFVIRRMCCMRTGSWRCYTPPLPVKRRCFSRKNVMSTSIFPENGIRVWIK